MPLRCLRQGLTCAAAVFTLAAATAHGQVLEHFPPQVPAPAQQTSTVPPFTGPALSRIVIAGGAALPDLSQFFVGKTLSPALIAEIEAAASASLGEDGHPVAARWMPDAGVDAGIVTLAVTKKRSWDAYAGLKYSSSDAFTYRRYLVGGSANGWLGHDSVTAFQVTGSLDAMMRHTRHPVYREFYLSYSLPLAPRTHFESSLDLDELNFAIAPSVYRFGDTMLTAGLRLDLPPAKDLASDWRFGVEAKNEQFTTVTNGAFARQTSSEVYQLYLGYHALSDSADAHDELDVAAHISPGGLDAGNTAAQFHRYSDGRVSMARYVYVAATFDHRVRLTPRLAWHAQVIGIGSTTAIPFSEQPGIGSIDLVRGYHIFDGSFDDSLVVRNELGFTKAGGDMASAPYLFWDMGSGRDKSLKTSDTLGSFGAGANIQVTPKTALTVDVTHTLMNGQLTRKDTDEVEANLTVKF